MLKLFPASYSNEDRLSYVVALVELIPGVFALAALARVGYFGNFQIDATSANLLSSAGILGIFGVVFGGWMCLRCIGRLIFRIMALGLGGLGVVAWPIANYISGLALH